MIIFIELKQMESMFGFIRYTRVKYNLKFVLLPKYEPDLLERGDIKSSDYTGHSFFVKLIN